MKTKTIAILFGGESSEYKVSLQSASAVIKNFPINKYNLYMIGITEDGKWYHYQGDIANITNDTWHLERLNEVSVSLHPHKQAVIEIEDKRITYCQLDAVLPMLHGKNGEDGTVQGLMKLANIPIIGCDLLSSALCMDKLRAHQLVNKYGINVAKAFVVMRNDDFNVKINKMCYPLFVKPLKAGSSCGISKVVNYQELKQAVNYAFKYDNEVIIEEEVLGIEVGCAIIGTNNLEVGLVDEIELSGGFFDFNEKYSLKSSKIHLPARLDQETIIKIQETAMLIYRILGCQVFARVDLFLTPAYEIYFNEVNTIPGFTTHSRFPQMMKGTGYDFPELIDKIIKMVISL